MPSSRRQLIPVGTLVLFALFLLVMLATYLLVKPPTPPPELAGVLRNEYRQLQPFSLVDQHGQSFDQRNLRGKWSLLFFGYLSCPDVCPMTMHELDLFWRLLEDEAGAPPPDLQVVFVSVDPARDTPARMRDYIAHFNPAFRGATAAPTDLDRLTRQLGVGYRIEPETTPGNYLVAHSSALFLVDPLGRPVATFSQPHYAATLQLQYGRVRAYFEGTG